MSVGKFSIWKFVNTAGSAELSFTGLEIATHLSPMRPKIEYWQLNFQNWSPAGDLHFVRIKLKNAPYKQESKLFANLTNKQKNKETDHFKEIFFRKTMMKHDKNHAFVAFVNNI